LFCFRELYTRFVDEMIVKPGTEAVSGAQADDHVSLNILIL